jgi:hypothetical protein
VKTLPEIYDEYEARGALSGESLRTLRQFLRDGDPSTVLTAVGDMRADLLAADVVPFLTHADSDVRCRATFALFGRLRHAASVDHLIELLDREKDSLVLGTALAAAGDILLVVGDRAKQTEVARRLLAALEDPDGESQGTRAPALNGIRAAIGISARERGLSSRADLGRAGARDDVARLGAAYPGVVARNTVTLPISMVFVCGGEDFDVPEPPRGETVAANDTCIVISTRVDADGPTSITLRERVHPVGVGGSPRFEGVLATPSRVVTVRNHHLDVLLHIDVPETRTHVQIWTNAIAEPDVIDVVVYPASEAAQRAVCQTYGMPFVRAPGHLKVGIARNVRDGLLPLNGLRHPPEGDTTGWYIWAGEELPADPDFFVPLHVDHLAEWCPDAIRYLGLPPGWRFLVAGDYEDVWYDASLLVVDEGPA